jgi:uncharacterized protein YgiM (DUF1202 family)
VTVYDLAEYLAPNSAQAYMLNSGELCQSVRDGKGYIRFMKNDHHETLWLDDRFIYRGLDTSNLPNPVYAQFTGERYGAVWCKRYMSVGDATERNPDIRTYDANGKLLSQDHGGVSYLHFVQHYTSYTFAETGMSAANVAELTWTFDAAGQNVIERYWYAKGMGLVGFSYYGSPPLHTRYSGLTPAKPTFIPLPNFAEPVPPPVEAPTPVPSKTPLGQYRLTTLPAVWVNVRAEPRDTAADLGDLRRNDVVTLFSPTVNDWVYVESQTVKGWVSLQNGKVAFAPVTAQPAFRLRNPVGCASVISSHFGVQRDYDGDGVDEASHEGVDITRKHPDCAPLILAPCDGVVMDVSSAGAYGNHVVISSVVSGQEYRVWLAHMAQVFVVKGQQVRAGAVVGVMGSTGNSTGLHLHLSVQKVGAPTPKGSPLSSVIDPEMLLDF